MSDSKIVFMDGYDEVRDIDTQDVIFNTEDMNNDVIDNVVNIWNSQNEQGGVFERFRGLDKYLLDEGLCTQDDREVIQESLYDYYLLGES